MPDRLSRNRSEDKWRQILTPEQYRVMRQHATEPAFTGTYVNEKDEGVYRCAACHNPLFTSQEKYDSGSGWPSFFDAVADTLELTEDQTHGMRRIEVLCANCKSHLGHVFPDGPQPTGLRYCINSVSLDLDRKADPSAMPRQHVGDHEERTRSFTRVSGRTPA